MPAPTTQSRQALRNRFVRHAIPTEKDFADLINASLNLADDGVVKLPDQPLGLVRQKQDQAVLRLYASPDADWTAWQMQLIGGIDKPGLGFTNQAGASALVLEGTSGHVGVGTTRPTARLTVCEANGSPAAANSGSLLIDHEDSGGASSIVFRSKLDRGNDFAYIEYRDKNPALSTSQASLLTIGIDNETDDHLALMPSGNVGIATKSPTAKLHVAGAMRVDAGLTVQGALSASGKVVIGQPGDASDLPSAGDLAIRSLQPMLDFIDTDPNQKDWRIFANESKLLFNSSPSANKTDLETFLTLNNNGTIKWLDLLEAANPIRISSQFTNQASHTHGERNNWAEICNDTNDYKCLMIVGNKSSNAGGNGRRKVGIYDDVVVAGDLQVNRNISALGKAEIGATASQSKSNDCGLSMQGQLALKGNYSQLDFIDNDPDKANWAIHVNEGRMCFIRAPWVYQTMILQANGNVAIGADSDTHKLHVAGTMKVDSTLTVQGNITTEGGLTAKGNIETTEGYVGAKFIGAKDELFLDNSLLNRFSITQNQYCVMFRLKNSTHGSSKCIYWDGGGWAQSSDETLKTDIEGVAGILQRLVQIDVKSFRWKGDEPTERKQVGFIAQQVQEVFPDLVKGGESGDDDGTNQLRLNYTGIGVLAVGAIKELKALFDQELAALRAELAELRLQRAPAHGDQAAAPASPTEVLP